MLKTKQIAKHIVDPNLDIYKKYGDVLPTQNINDLLIFQDNGSDVLAVAHLDTVLWCNPKINQNSINRCPQLDDRLGVATILEWLPTLGKFDVLLCDNEEMGDSTGQYFKPSHSRQYRYMIEFDRVGSDCVFYQYEREDLEYDFDEAGWDVGIGSFSDIAFMSHLNCQGVNIGIGYHNIHTAQCYCNMSEVNSQLVRFAMWYKYYGKKDYPFSEIDFEQYIFDKYRHIGNNSNSKSSQSSQSYQSYNNFIRYDTTPTVPTVPLVPKELTTESIIPQTSLFQEQDEYHKYEHEYDLIPFDQ